MKRNDLIRELISQLDESNDLLLIDLLNDSIDYSKVEISNSVNESDITKSIDVDYQVNKTWESNIRNYFKSELLKQEPLKSFDARKKRIESLTPDCESCKYQPNKHGSRWDMFDYDNIINYDEITKTYFVDQDEVEYQNRINDYKVQTRCLGCAKAYVKVNPELRRVSFEIHERSSLLFKKFEQTEAYKNVLNMKCLITELKKKVKENLTTLHKQKIKTT